MNKITTQSPPTQGVDIRQWVRAVPVRGTAHHVLCGLLLFSDEFGDCWPSIKTLSEACGLSDRCVQLRLRELESEGWIQTAHKKTKQGRDTASHYVLMLSKAVPSMGEPDSPSPPAMGEPRSPSPLPMGERHSPIPPKDVHPQGEPRSPSLMKNHLKNQEEEKTPQTPQEGLSAIVTDEEVVEHVERALSGEYGDIVRVRYGKATASQRRSLSRATLRRERRQCIVCSESLVGLNETLVKCAGCRASKRAVAR